MTKTKWFFFFDQCCYFSFQWFISPLLWKHWYYFWNFPQWILHLKYSTHTYYFDQNNVNSISTLIKSIFLHVLKLGCHVWRLIFIHCVPVEMPSHILVSISYFCAYVPLPGTLERRGSKLKSVLFLQRSQQISLNSNAIKIFQMRIWTKLRLLI